MAVRATGSIDSLVIITHKQGDMSEPGPIQEFPSASQEQQRVLGSDLSTTEFRQGVGAQACV